LRVLRSTPPEREKSPAGIAGPEQRDTPVKITLKKSLLASATCLAGGAAALFATPAFAQDTQPQDAQTSEADTAPESTIVVTGSLIRNPNLEQANPVNVTTADQIELKQSNTAEEVLREIPGIVANIGNAVNNGNNGASYVDLRGLGSNRNIVLLDGNRLPTGGLSTASGASSVDLNNIPLALISRVDSLTGAAVTTYGADAITGVINFITKKDFAGVELNVGNQITEEGDGNYFRTDLTVGANFEDGRGNAVLSVGYQESDPVYQGDRDFSAFQISSFSGTFGGSGTSVPTRFSGTRGLLPGTTTPDTNPASVNGPTRQIDATGAAVPTFALFNFAPLNVFQVPFKRYNIFAQANYEASDAVEVYTRGLFSKNTVRTIIAPSGSFGGSVNINLNNPLLPSTLRNQFCAFDVNADPAVYTPRFTPAQCAAGAAATGPGSPGYAVIGVPTMDTNGDGVINASDNPSIALSRRAVEVGPRISNYQTTVFDYRIGARGAITDSVDWDVSASYGESENVQTILNYTLQSRFRQGLLVDGTAANPVCTNTANGCVPVNIFGGAGTITPAQADFLNDNSSVTNRSSLAQVRGVVSGDLGFAFSEGAEPVGFALGGEYRRYQASQASDSLAKISGELGGAGGAAPDIDGGYDVYEAYGELIAPILDSLTVEGGARYSHYKVEGGGTNNTFTYKAGLSFQPIEDVKFRANYAHAVRAPNIYELFYPVNTLLTSLGTDPCAGAAPVTNANLRAICIAQGAPAGTIGSIANPTAAQANITTFGSTNLDPEKADTYTVGVVLQPRFLPRFSMSVDYYNIKVEDVIGTLLPGDIIRSCFGATPTTPPAGAAATPACTNIRRNPLTGGLDGDPSITPGLFAPITNQGRLFTDGIDVIANYQRDFGSIGWAVNFSGNYTFNSKFNSNVNDPLALNRECVGFYSSNCSFTGSLQPKFQWSLRNTFSIDDIDLSLLWRHIDKHGAGARRHRQRQRPDLRRNAADHGRERLPPWSRRRLPAHPIVRHLRPHDAVQRQRQPDVHRHRAKPVQQAAAACRYWRQRVDL
jgi:iron complex outermembrane recepter protein